MSSKMKGEESKFANTLGILLIRQFFITYYQQINVRTECIYKKEKC